jgi:peptide/nickel transport system substrate-binding protein
MNVKMIEWAAFAEKTQNHDFDAGTMGWGTGTDPDTAKNIWKTDQWKDGRNMGGYSNPRVDELFEQGRREFDHEKRRKIYQEINRILYEDQPYLFLSYRATLWAFSKECRGYNFSPRGPMGYSPGFSQIWKPKQKAP